MLPASPPLLPVDLDALAPPPKDGDTFDAEIEDDVRLLDWARRARASWPALAAELAELRQQAAASR